MNARQDQPPLEWIDKYHGVFFITKGVPGAVVKKRMCDDRWYWYILNEYKVLKKGFTDKGADVAKARAAKAIEDYR